MKTPKIKLENITKKFGDLVAVDSMNLEIENGEYFCLLGPSGAGKTTCMRIICGLTEPDSGKLFFDEKEVTDMPSNEREATMLSQTYSLFPNMDVLRNVIFSPTIKGWKEDEIQRMAKSMITMVHMNKFVHYNPNELSGGQQQRIALARALSSGSKILLLDEPLRALDARLRIELRKELKSMVKETKMTAVHVTHDQQEALEMADRIAIINDGKIIQVGTPKEIFENPNCPFVADFVGRSNLIKGTVHSVNEDGSEVKLDNGSVVPVKDTKHKPGDRVLVAVKIENTKISATKEGFFKGKIVRKLYEGAFFIVEMKVDGLEDLVITKLQNRKFYDYDRGYIVDIYWSASKTTVFDLEGENVKH